MTYCPNCEYPISRTGETHCWRCGTHLATGHSLKDTATWQTPPRATQPDYQDEMERLRQLLRDNQAALEVALGVANHLLCGRPPKDAFFGVIDKAFMIMAKTAMELDAENSTTK